jgi:hypothetical protein
LTIAGNLRTMNLADILQWLSTTAKTGTFVIDGSRYTKKILFRRGEVVDVSSDNPREMLGYFLVGWGICTEDELIQMVEMQDHFRTMLGELAVNLGHLTREELEQVLVFKTREAIFDLITWDHGEFRFVESELPDRDFLSFHLPVMSFLFEGFRQRDERMRMREIVPDSGYIPILVAPPDGLDETAMAIIQQMDGRRSVEDIALANRMPEFDVLKLVYLCAQTGSLHLHPPEKERLLPGYGASPWLNSEEVVRDNIIRGRFLDALKLVNSMREKYAPAGQWADHMVQLIESTMEENAFSGSDILEGAFELDELVNLDCDPAEGFVLSRVNGRYTVDDILRQLPGSPLTNRIIIHNLLRRGLVRARSATSVRRFRDEIIDDSSLEP